MRIQGIYAILPPDRDEEETLRLAEAAWRAGAAAVQLRDKRTGYKRRRKKAQVLAALARKLGGLFIVNDSVQLALEAGADGVHLGPEDLTQSIAAIRAEVGPGLIIGVSCRADAMFARQALSEGASYVSFGAVFPSRTKPEAPPIGLARLAKARALFPEANIVAIGGITQEAIAAVKKAGADAAAVSEAAFGGGDVEQRVRALVAAWEAA